MTIQTMRVAHLSLAFSPLSETFIYDYIKELERQGVENHVLTTRRINAQERPFSRVEVLSLPPRWHPSRVGRRLWAEVRGHHPVASLWPFLRPRLVPILRRLAPDIVHAHFGPMGVAAAPVCRALDIPLIVSFHGADAFQHPRSAFWRTAYSSMWQNTSAVTAVSQCMRNHLVGLRCPESMLYVVHVGKCMADYPFRIEPMVPIRKWLSVGRLIEKKGFTDLIQAFQRVVQKDPLQTLTIVGDGPLYQSLLDTIARLGLSEHVSLLGALPHATVKTKLQESDAFALCSKEAADGDREGIPTVLMEAQAMGLPCVSTRHSGIPEVFPSAHHHLLAAEGNVEEIADRILHLSTRERDEIEQISRLGREMVEQSFNLECEVRTLIQMYQQEARAT